MNFESYLLSEPAYEGVKLLIDLVLKGSLILCAALILTRFMVRMPAAARHLVWAMAFSVLLLLPLTGQFTPTLQVPILSDSWSADEESPVSPMVSESVIVAPELERSVLPPLPDTSPLEALGMTEETAGSSIELLVSPYLDFLDTAHWTSLLLIAWGSGLVFLLIWQVVGIVGVGRITHLAEPVESEDWRDAVEESADRLFVTRSVRLAKSRRIGTPVTWGVFRPIILLPVDADDWAAERRRAVLMHEMAHVRRFDVVTQTLAQVACSLHWFNPLAWRGLKALRIEQEKACDDLVLVNGTKASDYASYLLDLARSMHTSWASPVNSVAMARKSQLEGRVVDILDPEHDARPMSRRNTIITLLIGLLILGPITAVSPWRNDVEKAAGNMRDIFLVEELERAVLLETSDAPVIVDIEPLPDLQYVLADTSEERKRARAKVVEALRGALNDEDKDVRRHAVQMLAAMKDEGSIDALSEVLHSDANPDVRRAALMALVELSGPDVIQEHLRVLHEAPPDLRRLAAKALSAGHSPEVLETLLEMVDDTDAEVRRSVLIKLADYDDRRASAALARAMNDPADDVRRVALMALAEQRGEGAFEVVKKGLDDENPDIRRQAVLSLVRIDEEASLEVLIEVLKQDEDPQIRRIAALVLGDLGDLGAVDALTEALKDESPEVRRHAMQALSNLDLDGNGEGTDAARIMRQYERAARALEMAKKDTIERMEAVNRVRYKGALAAFDSLRLSTRNELAARERLVLERGLERLQSDVESGVKAGELKAQLEQLAGMSDGIKAELDAVLAEREKRVENELKVKLEVQANELKMRLNEIENRKSMHIEHLKQLELQRSQNDIRESIESLAKIAGEHEGSPVCYRVLAMLKSYDSPIAKEALQTVTCERE